MTDNEITRLSSLEVLILKMLINYASELYGLEMVDNSGGRLKRGTIYVTLGRMEKKGYIKSRKEKQQPRARGLPRRLYKITGVGRTALAAWEMPILGIPGGYS